MGHSIKVTIYPAENDEFGYRIKSGNSRITVVPGETYKTRQNVRSAVATLARWSTGVADGEAIETPLSMACHAELERETKAHDASKKKVASGRAQY